MARSVGVWYTAAAAGIQTRDLEITSPALYHTATSAPNRQAVSKYDNCDDHYFNDL